MAYGLSLTQVEQALAANNTNAGAGFLERAQQALNVRAVGLMGTTDDIGATMVKVQSGRPVRSSRRRECRAGAQGAAGTVGES